MTLTLFAQPYDIDATGFYFTSVDEYTAKADRCVNRYGQRVEEFEIQFIDGELIDCLLAEACGLYQSSISSYFECADAWDDDDKTRFIIAVDECGYDFDLEGSPSDLPEIDIYEEDSLKDLAMQFVDEGLFGEVPESFARYIDFDAIARDLAVDYSETRIAGKNLIYRCD